MWRPILCRVRAQISSSRVISIRGVPTHSRRIRRQILILNGHTILLRVAFASTFSWTDYNMFSLKPQHQNNQTKANRIAKPQDKIWRKILIDKSYHIAFNMKFPIKTRKFLFLLFNSKKLPQFYINLPSTLRTKSFRKFEPVHMQETDLNPVIVLFENSLGNLPIFELDKRVVLLALLIEHGQNIPKLAEVFFQVTSGA